MTEIKDIIARYEDGLITLQEALVLIVMAAHEALTEEKAR